MFDRFGLLPDHIRGEIENEDALDRQVGVARYIDQALKAHDPNLGLVFVKPNVEEWELPTGAIAGRWHVEVKAPGLPNIYYPIVGPEGEFREPTHTVLDEMQQRDLHREEAMRSLIGRQARAEAKARRQRELADEQRRDELALDLRAGKRVAGEGGLTKSKWGRG